MNTCYLVGASPEAALIAPGPGDCVIAADGGLRHLLGWGIPPDLVVGDMDSIEAPLPEGIPYIRVPAEKDDSDMALALAEGIRRGYRNFVLTGADGGRLDHTMANLQLLAGAAARGIQARLQGKELCAAVLAKGGSLRLHGSGTVSVFAYGDCAAGVHITGMKYPLSGATLRGDCPLGLSNVLRGSGEISVEQGALLIFWQSGIQSEPI